MRNLSERLSKDSEGIVEEPQPWRLVQPDAVAPAPPEFTRLKDGRVIGGDGSPIPELTGREWAERQEREAGS